MNFGQALFNWLIGNIQPLLLLGIAAVGIYLLIERKISKALGVIILGIVAVGFVFNTTAVKDLFLQLFNQIFALGG